MEHAFSQTAKGDRPSPANLIITHKDGIALGLELDPAGIDVLQPEAGVLVHTNHFIGPKFGTRTHGSGASTYIRLQRISAHLKSKMGITQEDIKLALRDHAGYPYSVCKHNVPTGDEREV